MVISKFTLILFLFSSIVFGQDIKGVVLEKDTKMPLEGATIYFDNTTIGVISDEKGNFKIPNDSTVTTPLIVSYVGYKKIILNEYSPSKYYKFLLEEDIESLDAVVINGDNYWTPKRKLIAFKKHFLGWSENAKSCKILNEKDIHLKFDYQKNQLIGSCNRPILIKNKNLNYNIRYDMSRFIINYKPVKWKGLNGNKHHIFYRPNSVLNEGTSFFKDIKKVNSRIVKDRNTTYLGSTIHFLKALRSKTLKENDYIVAYKEYKRNTDKYVFVTPSKVNGQVEVRFKVPKLVIVYKNNVGLQSSVELIGDYFTIDKYGNHKPIDNVIFSGKFGSERIGDQLPLNFDEEH